MNTNTNSQHIEPVHMDRDSGPWLETYHATPSASADPMQVVESAPNSSPHTELGESFMTQASTDHRAAPQAQRGANSNSH